MMVPVILAIFVAVPGLGDGAVEGAGWSADERHRPG